MKKPKKRKSKPKEHVKLMALNYPDHRGGISATLAHSGIPFMAAHFVKLFKESGGVNYVEWTMEDKKSPEIGPITVMIQRKHGKTPAEILANIRKAWKECSYFLGSFQDGPASPTPDRAGIVVRETPEARLKFEALKAAILG